MKRGWFVTFIDDWFEELIGEEKCEWGPYKTERRAETAYAVAKYSMGYKAVSKPFQRMLNDGEVARD